MLLIFYIYFWLKSINTKKSLVEKKAINGSIWLLLRLRILPLHFPWVIVIKLLIVVILSTNIKVDFMWIQLVRISHINHLECRILLEHLFSMPFRFHRWLCIWNLLLIHRIWYSRVVLLRWTTFEAFPDYQQA